LTESAAEIAAKENIVSRIVLIWFVLLSFLGVAGATVIANEAAAQDLAECTSLEVCGLAGNSVTKAVPMPIFGQNSGQISSDYGVILVLPGKSNVTLPHENLLQGQKQLHSAADPLPAPINSGWYRGYSASGPMAVTVADHDQAFLGGHRPGLHQGAFSYKIGGKWRFHANALDDNAVALQAIAAGRKRDPEDLLWNLSESDFSVNMGLVRRF